MSKLVSDRAWKPAALKRVEYDKVEHNSTSQETAGCNPVEFDLTDCDPLAHGPNSHGQVGRKLFGHNPDGRNPVEHDLSAYDPINRSTAEWRDQFTVVRELISSAERSAFYRSVERGHFVAVTRGVYLRSEVWSSLDRHAKYRCRVKAGALIHPDATFSHYSAAALWRLPWVGSWPQRTHVLAQPRSGGCSTKLVMRHTLGLPEEIASIDGIRLTPLARTVVDVASIATFEQAVAAADAALRRATHPLAGLPRSTVTHADLLSGLDRISPTHGAAKARAAIEFASPLADRPGESVSRVSMLRAGLPAPELQVKLTGASGRVWTVDFWWPHTNLIGEFDGKWKYTDPEFLRGRTAAQVLIDEKDREDDLRAAKHSFARWGWTIAVSPARLGALLSGAGLRR